MTNAILETREPKASDTLRRVLIRGQGERDAKTRRKVLRVLAKRGAEPTLSAVAPRRSTQTTRRRVGYGRSLRRRLVPQHDHYLSGLPGRLVQRDQRRQGVYLTGGIILVVERRRR